MLRVVLAVLFTLSLTVVSYGQTVQSAASSRGCNTAVVAGLSKQLVQQTNLLQPGLFTDISRMSGIRLSTAAAAVPYLQTVAAEALQRVVSRRGSTLSINSALRTLPQQLLLRKWYEARACGITAAAQPGQSNHNGGLAVDVNDPYSWVSSMSSGSFRHLGAGDPPHFDFTGSGRRDVRSLSVRAFQVLWNKNARSASERLPEDGVYNSAVERALLSAPINGFPNGPSGGSSSPSSPSSPPPSSSPSSPPSSSLGSCGSNGRCIDVSSTNCNGQIQSGLCPGGSNIRCCIPRASSSFGTCNVGGRAGQCINTDTTNCGGSLHSGFCPGSSNIRCCVSRQNAVAAESQTMPSSTSSKSSDNTSLTVAVVVVGSLFIIVLGVAIVFLARRLKSVEKV